MKNTLNAAMHEATRLTQAGRLTEATAALQRMLGGGHLASVEVPALVRSAVRLCPPTLEGVAEPAETTEIKVGQPRAAAADDALHMRFRAGVPTGPTMPGGTRDYFRQDVQSALNLPSGGLAGPSSALVHVPVPDGAQFLAATFSNKTGSRPYKLYVPTGYHPGRPVPLIVMLHGCTQSPDDFAAGTRMNEAAEEHTCLVVYPGQTASANMQRCWNWFSEGDQRRGKGEPLLIADLARHLMCEYAVDPRRVYVAGLSAGGAAAAIMGDAYPDLFAAIGVHSGLACGVAHDMPSAFAAMRGGGAPQRDTPPSNVAKRIIPTIVFHGDRDRTVHPRNGDAVVAQSARAAVLIKHVDEGRSGGQAYSRSLNMDEGGNTVIEQWVLHGAGHAWSGGSAAGSYTDPHGPDATREMLRFFLEHPHPAPGYRERLQPALAHTHVASAHDR